MLMALGGRGAGMDTEFEEMRTAAQRRVDGFAAIEDYAVLGDGRTAALVAPDGAIDWLPVPRLDAPPVLSALLDPDRGGRFILRPTEPFGAERCYLPRTNVLRTTFTCAGGSVRVTDALTLGVHGPPPWTEPARCVEGLSGEVPMEWVFEPGERFGQGELRFRIQEDIPIARVRGQNLAVMAHRVGETHTDDTRIRSWIDTHCWSPDKQSYTFHAGTDELDAAVLLAARTGYLAGDEPRLAGTVRAGHDELGAGPWIYRFSGMREKEGAFVSCSFWMVQALAVLGHTDPAERMLAELLAHTNDVGLFAEQIGPSDTSMRGNFPQALSHLAMVNAVTAVYPQHIERSN